METTTVTESVTSIVTTTTATLAGSQLELINKRLEFIVAFLCFCLLVGVMYGLYRFLKIFI